MYFLNHQSIIIVMVTVSGTSFTHRVAFTHLKNAHRGERNFQFKTDLNLVVTKEARRNKFYYG